MKAHLVGEPKYPRRTWTTASGDTKSAYSVRWRIGIRGADGRSVRKEKRGFRTKAAAQKYFYDHILPALDAGHASPLDQYRAEVRERDEEEAARKSVADLIQPLMENKPVHAGQKSFGNLLGVYRLALTHWGRDRKLDTIGLEGVEKFLALPTSRKTPPSGETVRKRLFVIRAAFERAVDFGYIAANPCAKIKAPKPGKGRLRYLTAEECKKLLEACGKYEPRKTDEPDGVWLYTFVITALYTGARLDELQHLEWADIDWDLKKITVQNKPGMNWKTKSGENRSLGVNDLLIEALGQYRQHREAQLRTAQEDLRDLTIWMEATIDQRRALPRPKALCRYDRPPGINKLIRSALSIVRSLELQINSPLVFASPDGGIRTDVPRGYWEIIKNLGLKKTGVNFHTLRHTYASHLAQAGVDMQSLKQLMGHASIVTTMRYAHLAPDHASKKGALMPAF
ncbi:tyrosine-type recombinase/integrase [Candidatus Sumerlaeota bacterium]|nr:tyrosine-type recombinase/integrase [Candidatus Sumerlaeota bacterium]